MAEDLQNEIEVINSIYGTETLRATGDQAIFLLVLPLRSVTLRVRFPASYPLVPPEILGTESIGNNAPKGYGNGMLKLAREVLGTVWKPGEVCLYDLIVELEALLENKEPEDGGMADVGPHASEAYVERMIPSENSVAIDGAHPEWNISSIVTEKKSVFVARACKVSSKFEAASHIAHLLATDRKIAKATHNITAYRIQLAGIGNKPATSFQDCDDDGESAAGGRLLHLLQVMNVWNVLVVVSRWYGGVKLGPDRFRIINQVARDALVKGGWTAGGEHGMSAHQHKR